MATDIPPNCKLFYRLLWNLDLPLKIKITKWWISLNFLLTLSNLLYKRLVEPANCPRCLNGAETLKHVFRDYTKIKEIWENLHVTWSISVEDAKYKKWINFIFENNSFYWYRIVTCAIWAIWTMRNKFIHEGEQSLG